MKKRVFLRFLMLAALIMSLGLSAQMEASDGSGTSASDSRFGSLRAGDGLQAGTNNAVTFSFNVYDNDWMEQVAEITGYTGSTATLVIPETVSDEDGQYKVASIAEGAFRDHDEIHFVVFPESLRRIDNHAFFSCTSLEEVVFPDNVEEIGAFAFGKCTNLTTLELPKNVKKICGGAFAMTNRLTQVTIPKSLEETTDEYDNAVMYGFHHGIFMKSTGLKSVSFEAGTTRVVNGVLANTMGLERVDIPEGITVIEANAFKGCENLEEVNLPETLTGIEAGAFYGCASLPEIDIPDSVTRIDEFAFAKCAALTRVHLPDRLESVGGGAFGACNALTSVEIPAGIQETNTAYDASILYGYHYGVFMQCENLAQISFRQGITKIARGLFANIPGLKAITLPDTVTLIEDSAFRDCKYLEEVIFPKMLTTIEGKAFYNCASIKKLDFPDTVKEIGGFAFAGLINMTELRLPARIVRMDGGAFAKCDSLGEVTIPKTLAQVESQYEPDIHYGYESGIFLEGMGPTKIIFEEGTETILNSMLGFSRGVTEIVLPNTVKTIDDRAFVHCDSLEEINLPDSLVYIGPNVFSNCGSLKEITVPAGVTQIKANTFEQCVSLARVNLPLTLTYIGANAFRKCAFPQIDIPETVTTIENDAFRENAVLTSVMIPAAVVKLGDRAFQECTALKKVELTTGLETIGAEAFLKDKALEEITIPNSVTSLGKNALMACESLASVTLSQGLTELSEGLLADDPALTEVKVPYRVSKLNKRVFENDTNLMDVTLLAAVESIGEKAFSYPAQLTIHGVNGSYAESYATQNAIRFEPLGEIGVTALEASPTELVIDKGKSARIILTIEPEDFTGEVTMELRKSDEAVISIENQATGQIYGKAAGQAEVKISAGDMVIRVPVTVRQPVEWVSIEDAPETMSVGETVQLTANVHPENAYDKSVTWSSSEPGVLSVDDSGLVTAVGKGEATITAKSVDGSKSDSRRIRVPNQLFVVTRLDDFESPHNYANNCSDIWTYTLKDAEYLDVTFDERTSLEDEYDYLYVTDSDGMPVAGESEDGYTGAELAGKTIRVYSDTVRISLISGANGTDWGFKVISVTSGATEWDFILPEELVEIGDEAFKGAAFTSVRLSDSVQWIGEMAFADCRNLTDIFIPAGVEYIADDAFENDGALRIHGERDSFAQDFAEEQDYTFIPE